jgi:hypothetical protein
MSHFAKILEGIVVEVIVAEQDFIDSGAVGDGWLQTSYNTRGGVHYGPDGKPDGGIALRANYAGVGYVYDAINDVFYESRPLDINGVLCESFIISAPTWIWQNPVPPPADMGTGTPPKMYGWNEPTTSWIELDN